MSCYPNIIFFRYEEFNEIDSFIEQNKHAFKCTFNITSNISDLNKLFNCNYHLLVTYGDDTDQLRNNVNSMIAERMRNRWLHFINISNIGAFNQGVNYCYIENVISNKESLRPSFSIFTSCFNSYH